jgi:hypothetical protein
LNGRNTDNESKRNRQITYDYTINLAGGYIQLLKGKSPLPKPKQNVTVIKRR